MAKFVSVAVIFMMTSAVGARALTLDSFAEIISIANVGYGWTSVSFENSYTNAVPVCTYTLASASNEPATVRIDSLSGSGMLVKIQEFPDSNAVTAGQVQCLIVEAGVHTFEDGTVIEARTANTTATNGQYSDDTWTIATAVNMSSSFTGTFSNPMALGQIITYNDNEASVPWLFDCDNRGNPPFLSGQSDGICVGKHIGMMTGARANETIGVIVIDEGTAVHKDIEFTAARGADTGAGTGNSPPYSYTLSDNFEYGVATQVGEDGGNGGWVVFYGANPVSTTLNWAIEEEDAAGDTSRRHTSENVDYFVVRRVPLFEIAKAVDIPTIGEPTLLSFTITIENTGRLDQTGVSIVDTLPDASTGTVSGPTESFTGGTAGVFEIGETWTYTVTYSATAADVTASVDLTNSVSASSNEYTSEGFADETDTAITTIVPPVPGLSITKVADDETDVPVGQTVNYTFTVTNTGNITIDDVTIADTHNGSGAPIAVLGETLLTDNGVSGDSTDATANDGTWSALAPGDVVTFTGSYIVTQSDIDTL